jgi:hypothetical protein
MLTFGALVAAAWVLGWPVVWLGVRGRTEALVLRFAIGGCAAGLVAMTLGSVSLQLAATVLYAVAALGLLAEVTIRKAATSPMEEAGPPFDWLESAALAATAAALVLAFLSATAPVTGWDAGVAHLALPGDYAREGRIYLETGNVQSAYPHLVQSLYAVAFHSAGETAVSWLNWSFGLLGCAALFALGRRVAGRQAGLIAAALYATAPVFMDQASAPSLDLAFAAISAAALLAITGWFDERRWGWLVVAAVLAGASCGIRHTGYLVCLFLLLGTLLGSQRQRFHATALFAVIGVAAAAPWLVRTGYLVGNPFFPFLSGVFATPPIVHQPLAIVGAHESIAGTGGLGILKMLRFPWDIIMRPQDYDGWTKNPGAMVLILGIPGLILAGGRVRRLGVYGVAGVGAFFFFQRLARYMLPFFLPFYVAAGAAVPRLGRLRVAVSLLLCGAFAFHLGLHVAAMHFKAPVLLGRLTKIEYLRERIERYPAFEYANENLADGRVLTPDQRTLYLKMPSFQNHWAMLELATLPPHEQRAWLREQGIAYVLIPWTFLEESGAIGPVLTPMFRQWMSDEAGFRHVKTMELPRSRGPGVDRVDFLEVLP